MKKTYVLNKPALLTSEDALSRFKKCDLVIPMAVLEDLKVSLKSLKPARRVIGKNLFKYLENFDTKILTTTGVDIGNGTHLKVSTNYSDVEINADNISNKDRRILQTCKGLMEEGKTVVLISNDEIVRMKARMNNIVAEELKDRVFPPLKDQYKGYADVSCSTSSIDELFAKGYLDIDLIYNSDKVDWLTNLYLNIEGGENSSALGYFDGEKIVPIEEQRYPYKIKPKNVKQRFLLHALMDTEAPIVIAKGSAGTGKTFCSLAAGLQLTMEDRTYEQILITRAITNGNGEEYGYLPGEITAKFDPYIYGVYDNLERLYNPAKGKYDDNCSKGTSRESCSKKHDLIRRDLFESGIIEIQPLGFIRGRSISQRWFIIDEMQNVDPEFAKSIVSRAGEGSKFIFLGDPTQIDAPELSETYNGIVYLSEMMKGQKLCRQIAMGGKNGTIRSPLAQLAVDILV